MRRAWVLILAVALAGCLPKVPRQRLTERARVAVVYVVDPSQAGQPTGAPEALTRAVAAELDARNLEVVTLPVESLEGQRLTDARLEALKRAAADAPFVLLVELKVQFFSQLDGRYRWEVGTSLSAARPDGPVAKDPFETPVVLLYDHEKEREAIAQAAPDIAARTGTLLDALLVGAGVAPHTEKGGPRAIYFVMLDRFANGDPSNDTHVDVADPSAFHGGDLEGLIARLDWIQALGVDTIWLSPIFRMRTEPWHGHGAFHGYWTWDLSQIEPAFGDDAQVRRLRAELDRRGMKLLLDLVLNHVGPDAPLLTQHPDWFHHLGGVSNWSDPVQLTTHDVHGLPDLATEKPEVYAYLTAATRRWLRAGAA